MIKTPLEELDSCIAKRHHNQRLADEYLEKARRHQTFVESYDREIKRLEDAIELDEYRESETLRKNILGQ